MNKLLSQNLPKNPLLWIMGIPLGLCPFLLWIIITAWGVTTIFTNLPLACKIGFTSVLYAGCQSLVWSVPLTLICLGILLAVKQLRKIGTVALLFCLISIGLLVCCIPLYLFVSLFLGMGSDGCMSYPSAFLTHL